jgi:protein ImuA
LVLALARQPGPVVLVSPPRAPFVPALAAQGLPADRWLRVDTATAATRLWATEQALRCAEVAAVLAWLPQTEAADLRRLQLAAQRHRQLLFVMRPLSAHAQASPARLRLMVDEAGTPPSLRVQVLKRRGPPWVSPLRLPGQPPLLARLLRSRRSAPWPLEVLAGASLSAAPPGSSPESLPSRVRHGLDRAPTRA